MNELKRYRTDLQERALAIAEAYCREAWNRVLMEYLTRGCMTDMGISFLKRRIAVMKKDGRLISIRPTEFYVDPVMSQSPDFVPDRWRPGDRFNPDDRITLCLGSHYFETSGGREIRPARALPFL